MSGERWGRGAGAEGERGREEGKQKGGGVGKGGGVEGERMGNEG